MRYIPINKLLLSVLFGILIKIQETEKIQL